MKKVIRKILIRGIIIIFISIVIVAFVLGSSASEEGQSQFLNSIDYDVTVFDNGDARIIETWDINIKNTNTLFKTFNLSPSKYSGIRDVEVGMMTDNEYVPLRQIYEEMYHVTTGCYYGLDLGYNTFEIAWGTGLEESSARRKYQISYVVEDLVTDYSDCQEIYWQFLEKGQNTIPAKKVTGRVNLPQDVENIDNLRVWGHGQLNGEINKVNNHQVEFKLNGLEVGSRLEVRVVTQDKMFYVR